MKAMDKSAKFFDNIAKRSAKPSTKLGQTSLKTVEATRKYLKPSDQLLDFGCGPGNLTLALAKDVQSIHAMDISAGMIAVAKQGAAEQHIENIDFSQSSIFDPAFEKESFDVILAFNVLHYMEEVSEEIQRIHDLLKPGGLFISSTACMKEKKSFLKVLMSVLTGVGIVPKMQFYGISELEGIIENSHFKLIETQKLSSLPDYFVVGEKR